MKQMTTQIFWTAAFSESVQHAYEFFLPCEWRKVCHHSAFLSDPKYWRENKCQPSRKCAKCRKLLKDRRPNIVLLVVGWENNSSPFVLRGRVSLDTGTDKAPTQDEMQSIAFAAKMEWAKCLRKRKKAPR